jgi:hypothetical protein
LLVYVYYGERCCDLCLVFYLGHRGHPRFDEAKGYEAHVGMQGFCYVFFVAKLASLYFYQRSMEKRLETKSGFTLKERI